MPKEQERGYKSLLPFCPREGVVGGEGAAPVQI